MAGKTKLVGKNLDIALKMLHDVTSEIEKANIPYWLEGGTLLGIIRENRILPWDNDMDISMDSIHKNKLLWVSMKLFFKGYRISIKHFKKNFGPFKKGEFRMIKIRNFEPNFKKGEVMLDVFVKRKIDEQLFWAVGVKSPVLKSSPTKFTNQLDWYGFNKKKYMVPHDYKGYLTYRYGDWKIPVKTWDFKLDDNAIVSNN